MTKDDIIRMARDSEMFYQPQAGYIAGLDRLERFAALVAATERKACLLACEAIETDRWALYMGYLPYNGTEDGRACEYVQGQSDGASACVAAIKARSAA